MAKTSNHLDRKPTRRPVGAARRRLAADGALPPEPGDPELGAYLHDVLRELYLAEDAALTVSLALQGMQSEEAPALAMTLSVACKDKLTEQIERLERAVNGAYIAGPSIVINSNRLVPGGDSQARVQP